MNQKMLLDTRTQQLQRINKKLNYLMQGLEHDEESDYTLQVFYDNSDLCSGGKAQTPERLYVIDNQKGTFDNELLKQLSKEGEELNLSKKKISHHETPALIKSLSSFKNLLLLDLSSNFLGDKGIELLSSNRNKHLALLEHLNIADNQFGNKGSKSLSLNTIWESLKALNLSNNPLGSDGIKAIAQNPAWTGLQVLVLNRIGLDQNGAKALAANESWRGLEELYMNGNYELGDQGFVAIAYNNTWIKLKRLSICACGIRTSALTNLKRNKYWKNFKIFHLEDSIKLTGSLVQSCFRARRGGGDKKTDSTSKEMLELSSKISQYKESVKNNKSLDSELSLYMETRAKDNLVEDIDEKNIETFGLDFKIKAHFLDADNSAKVLLVTGATGVGKSLFCRYLQRSVLMYWNPDDQQEVSSSENNNNKDWLPIYVDLSKLKNAKTAAASEALTRELQLTESEIKLFQDSSINSTLPRLLFIFDGYDTIQDIRELQGYQNLINNNFYISNGFGKDWATAKLIITCREESLNNIDQRELLFAPIDENKGVTMSGSYLEYAIQPFSDIEITAYLRKYVIDQFPTRNQDDDININSSSSLHYPDSLQTGGALSSWGLVHAYEEFMDLHKSREILRIPFLLSIAVDTLRDVTELGGYDKVSYVKEIKSSSSNAMSEEITEPAYFGRWFYYEAHINRLLGSAAEKEGKEINRSELVRRLQYHALSIDKLVVDSKDIAEKKAIEAKLDEMLISCSLITKTWYSGIKFTNRSVQEFLIAQAIVSDLDGHLSDPQNMILNQKLLEPHSQVMAFIVDAYKGAIIDSQALLKLVTLTKESKLTNGTDSKEEESKGTKNKNQLSIAAANAMTILNLAKFDFQKLDLSDVNIPGAYLSFGKFEGTDFSRANLTGVNFTKAWLRDTNFTGANLTDVEFGVLPDVSLYKPLISLDFSQNGQRLAAAVGKEVAIFEKDAGGLFFKEVLRLRGGHYHGIEHICFSSDGKKIMSASKDPEVCVWDVETGELLQELPGRRGSRKSGNFSLDGAKMATAFTDHTCLLWNAGVKEPLLKIKNTSGNFLRCEFSPDARLILYYDVNDHMCRISDTDTGKLLKLYKFTDQTAEMGKYRYRYIRNLSDCKFVGDGRMIATRRCIDNAVFYCDTIRGTQLKTFKGEDVVPFNPGTTQTIVLKDYDIMLQDTATGQVQKIVERNPQWVAARKQAYRYYYWDARDNYSISGDKRSIAKVVERKTMISFVDIPSVNQRKNDLIGGDNKKGLELTGAIIDNSIGLCKERIPLFIQYGDYSEFSEDIIQGVLLGTSDHSSVKEVNLNSRKVTDKGATIIGRNSTWVNLEKLELQFNSLGDNGTVAIAKNTTWVHLKILNLKNNSIRTEGVQALAENTAWTELEELLLSSNDFDWKAGEALGKNTSWTKLKKLDLEENSLESAGISALAKNTTWINLEELDLEANAFDDKAVADLSQNTTWTKLKKLSLKSNNITSVGAGELVKNTAWKNLEALILSNNKLNDSAALELSKNTTWEKLKSLDLDSNPLTEKGIIDLAKNTAWKNLKSLSFRVIPLKVEGTKALSLNTAWKDIQTINLSKIQMTDKGLEHLATNAKWSNLTTIHLEHNYLTHVGIEFIAKNKCWSNLEVLHLNSNDIGDQGVASLCKNKQWKNLKTLDLWDNKLRAAAIKSLVDKNPWVNLEELNLRQNKINAEGAKLLCECTSWPKLRELNLGYNAITNNGVAALGANKSWTSLQKLNLEHCSLHDKGLEEFAKNTAWIKLEELTLSGNQIGPVGLGYLSANESWTNLKKLYLNYNHKITAVGALELCNNESWVNLEEVHLYGNSLTGEVEAGLRENTAWSKLQNVVV